MTDNACKKKILEEELISIANRLAENQAQLKCLDDEIERIKTIKSVFEHLNYELNFKFQNTLNALTMMYKNNQHTDFTEPGEKF